MIQFLNNLFIDPKLASATEGSAESQANMLNPETMLEAMDFSNELMASLGTQDLTAIEGSLAQASPAVKGDQTQLHIQSQQLKGLAIDLPVMPEVEMAAPSVVDPSLTKEVGDIFSPKNLQVQNQAQRSPAVVLDDAEISSQLMSFEDFAAQKNALKKAPQAQAAYGMNSKSQAVQNMSELGLASTQVVKESNSSEGMNAQEFILNNQVEQNKNSNQLEVSANQTVKTFNMNNVKTENAEQIMNEISNYIVQSKAAKETTVNLRVNHQELGMIDITVNKLAQGQDAIGVQIGTHSLEGKNFFQTNAKDLMAHLASTGLNVSDVKVESSSNTQKSGFDFNGQNQGHSSERQASEQNQRRNDSQRRQDLWDLLNNKEAA